jgi:hypothetical protein
MRFFRWAARLLSPSRLTAAAAVAWRVFAGLCAALICREAVFIAGLALIAAGLWPFSCEAALVIVGLLLVRDAEQPDRDKP